MALCLPPARLVKVGITQILHSTPVDDNFSFIKADIMTLPPTKSAVVMKLMFPENIMLCSEEVQQKPGHAAAPWRTQMYRQ